MKKYILALDEGTTSVRSILFDREGNTVSVAQSEFSQIYPEAGLVEHDAEEIYTKQYATITECIIKSRIDVNEIAAIGITNQRETTVVWEKSTGKPVYNAIVWQCRRTADICEKLVADGYSDYIKETTGLIPDAYFSATKIKWILDNVKGAREKAEAGELLFGTVDTWLLWKLTDGEVHATDFTNASRTMLCDINTGKWDDKMLGILGIPKSMLPEICSSSEIYGTVNIMGAPIPVSGIAGDQQAALFGQRCFNEGDVKVTYGTGCFLLANTGDKKVSSRNGLVTTVAATEKGKPFEYVLEGSVFVGGAVIQWLRDEMKLIEKSKDCEKFACELNSNDGVYLVPAFSGLGAPYWDMNARGTVVGLTRGAGRNHIIRAALESIAYQTHDIITSMSADLGRKIDTLKVDGGATANEFLMQLQADITKVNIFKPFDAEATALGAAYLAGLAVGFYKDRGEISAIAQNGKNYVPQMSDENSKKLLDGWHNAVRMTMA